MKKKGNSNITFAVIWNTDIISNAIGPYTNWEICFAALDFIIIAQVRYRALLYTGSIAVFDANFIQFVELFSTTPFADYLWVIIVHVLAIGHLDEDCEWYNELDHCCLRNSEISTYTLNVELYGSGLQMANLIVISLWNIIQHWISFSYHHQCNPSGGSRIHISYMLQKSFKW